MTPRVPFDESYYGAVPGYKSDSKMVPKWHLRLADPVQVSAGYLPGLGALMSPIRHQLGNKTIHVANFITNTLPLRHLCLYVV